MPTPGARSKGQRQAAAKETASAGRLDGLSKSTAQIVKDAAALLDEELASGIVAARQVQQRFAKERRVDPQDFSDAMQRFQANAHEVITLLNRRLDEMRSEENFEVVKKLVDRSHDLVDLAVELVNSSAEIATQSANSQVPKPKQGSRASRKG